MMSPCDLAETRSWSIKTMAATKPIHRPRFLHIVVPPVIYRKTPVPYAKCRPEYAVLIPLDAKRSRIHRAKSEIHSIGRASFA